ncbi:UBX domain [Sesbania bispinosa]|nr:UBX domain [Sesbania bispinosa]
MVTPTPDAVAAFMRITGASEFVAVQKLEEYGGNLNEAVNAHFIEGERHIQEQNLPAAAPQYNYSEVNNQNRAGSHGILPLLNAARRFRPSLLLDPNYRREIRDLCNGMGGTTFTSQAPAPPHASHPGEVREVPAGINSAFGPHYQSGLSSTSAGMTGNFSSPGRGIHGTEDYRNDYMLARSNTSHVSDKDIEEAMIQAAIEASEKERREGTPSNQNVAPDVAQPVMGHPLNNSTGGHHQGNEDMFISDKWGGISSDELNEALALETALFGETLNNSSHKFSSMHDLQHHPEKNVDSKIQCSTSSARQLLTDTQLLRQQQDADYLASLQADKQKELNSLKKAESLNSNEEESHKEMLERKELEKMHDMKEVTLPKEPPLDDEKAISIVVRMPNGGRCERRFLKTDKLQMGIAVFKFQALVAHPVEPMFLVDFEVDSTLSSGISSFQTLRRRLNFKAVAVRSEDKRLFPWKNRGKAK